MRTPNSAATAATKSGRAADAEALASHDDSCQSSERCDVDQFDDRRDDDGRERRLGQLLEQAGQEQQRHDRERGDDEAGHLALGAGAAVDGRLREAAVDDHAARQARSEIRGAESEQLAVGVDLVVVLGGVRLGCAQAFRKSDQHDADGAAGELEVLLGADVRSPSDGAPVDVPDVTPCLSRSNA